MKTPREIFLARHGAAAPKLDAIREAVVAAVCDRRILANQAGERRSQTAATIQGSRTRFASLCLRCLTAPWNELILPSRRLWTGLAAVWILIFIINVSQRDPVSSVTGQPARSPAVAMNWQTQQRWMNELLADRVTSPEADRPRTVAPKPRSENCNIIAG